MKPITLITGATSGIGQATAQILHKSYRLIICGRRAERLKNLQKELGGTDNCQLLCFDISSREETFQSFNQLPEEWKKIDVLINNAGNAHGLAPIHEGNVDDWEAMIDINIKGVLYMTKLISPGMADRKRGHIINIGSIAGLEVYPKGNVYSCSKHAVSAITKGTRQDLNPYGIKVTAINPGLVETEFSLVRFKGDHHRAKSVYAHFEPLLAQDIAETIQFILNRPPHVVIGDLMILPTAQADTTILKKNKN